MTSKLSSLLVQEMLSKYGIIKAFEEVEGKTRGRGDGRQPQAQ